jgi:hypothetical protein
LPAEVAKNAAGSPESALGSEAIPGFGSATDVGLGEISEVVEVDRNVVDVEAVEVRVTEQS